jgi:hypothetical protein
LPSIQVDHTNTSLQGTAELARATDTVTCAALTSTEHDEPWATTSGAIDGGLAESCPSVAGKGAGAEAVNANESARPPSPSFTQASAS